MLAARACLGVANSADESVPAFKQVVGYFDVDAQILSLVEPCEGLAVHAQISQESPSRFCQRIFVIPVLWRPADVSDAL